MAILTTAQTGAALTQDPAISLKNILGADATTTPAGQYGLTTPPSADVRFDTKFGIMSKHNIIIIENMPANMTFQTLGGNRFKVKETKRVQIWCDGKSAKNNKWLLEQECLRIINTNLTGLRTVGIDEMHAYNLTELPLNSSGDEADREGYLARSYFLVDLTYDLTKT